MFNMDPRRYYPLPLRTVLWAHKPITTKICLCVGGFGVKYFSKADVNHLIKSLNNHNKISTDWESCNYLGLTIDCDNNKEYVDILMPEYVKKRLIDSNIPIQKRPQYSPHRLTVTEYGKRLQMVPDPDKSNIIDKKVKNIIQYIIAILLYYAWSVDPIIL